MTPDKIIFSFPPNGDGSLPVASFEVGRFLAHKTHSQRAYSRYASKEMALLFSTAVCRALYHMIHGS